MGQFGPFAGGVEWFNDWVLGGGGGGEERRVPDAKKNLQILDLPRLCTLYHWMGASIVLGTNLMFLVEWFHCKPREDKSLLNKEG